MCQCAFYMPFRALEAPSKTVLFCLRNGMASHLSDPLLLLRFLLLILYSLVEPILLQLSQPNFRSSAIGLILMLLVVISILELFLMYIFHMMRLALVVVLVSLLGASLLTWFASEIPGESEVDDSSGRSEGTDTNKIYE